MRSLKARLAALLAAEEEGAAAEDADGETGTGQLQQRGPGAHGRPLRALLPRRVLLPGQVRVLSCSFLHSIAHLLAPLIGGGRCIAHFKGLA